MVQDLADIFLFKFNDKIKLPMVKNASCDDYRTVNDEKLKIVPFCVKANSNCKKCYSICELDSMNDINFWLNNKDVYDPN
jgi:hypothetical protein